MNDDVKACAPIHLCLENNFKHVVRIIKDVERGQWDFWHYDRWVCETKHCPFCGAKLC